MIVWEVLVEIYKMKVNPLLEEPPPGRCPEARGHCPELIILSIDEDVNWMTVKYTRP